jgi:ribosomal protein L33
MDKQILTAIVVVVWMTFVYCAGKGNLLDAIPKMLQKNTKETTKVGEWKFFVDDYGICASEFVCSECKESFVTSELTDDEFFKMMKYCPHCGAKMGDKNVR